jgi:hypothetical protein
MNLVHVDAERAGVIAWRRLSWAAAETAAPMADATQWLSAVTWGGLFWRMISA